MKHFKLKFWAHHDLLMALMSIPILTTGIEMLVQEQSGWWIVIALFIIFVFSMVGEPLEDYDQHDKARMFVNSLIITVWTVIFNWLPFSGTWSFIVAFAGACVSSHYLVPVILYGFVPQINDGVPPAELKDIRIKKLWKWKSK